MNEGKLHPLNANTYSNHWSSLTLTASNTTMGVTENVQNFSLTSSTFLAFYIYYPIDIDITDTAANYTIFVALVIVSLLSQYHLKQL